MTQLVEASHSSFMDQIMLAVEKLGRSTVIKLLHDAILGEFANPATSDVVTKVANKMGLPTYEIMKGNGRSNERKYAIGFCVYYLRSIHKFDMEEIKDFMGKHITICYKYYDLIVKLSPKRHNEEHFIELKSELDEIIKA